MAALDAGQAAGGDTRGMQSAAMLIVKKNGGVWLNNDVVLRLQVDDNPEPLKELRRLVEKWNAQRRPAALAPGTWRAKSECQPPTRVRSGIPTPGIDALSERGLCDSIRE